MAEHRRGHHAGGPDGVEDLFGSADEIAALLAGLDRDAVEERSLLWRSISARGCGLEPDADAERALRDRLAASELVAARSPSVWGSLLANLTSRAESSGCGPAAADTPPALLAGVVNHEDQFPEVIGRLADHADPVEATVSGAAWLCERVAAAEGLDETPATVAMWAVADVLGNLDVWVHAMCEAADAGRPDVAAAGLAGLVLAFPPDSAPVGDLDAWVEDTIDEVPNVVPSLKFTGLGGYSDARAALGARDAHVEDVVDAHGWVPTGWAIGALIVEAAVEAAARDALRADVVLRELLACWPVLSEAVD